jgi:hypothetical protein
MQHKGFTEKRKNRAPLLTLKVLLTGSRMLDLPRLSCTGTARPPPDPAVLLQKYHLQKLALNQTTIPTRLQQICFGFLPS